MNYYRKKLRESQEDWERFENGLAREKEKREKIINMQAEELARDIDHSKKLYDLIKANWNNRAALEDIYDRFVSTYYLLDNDPYFSYYKTEVIRKAWKLKKWTDPSEWDDGEEEN